MGCNYNHTSILQARPQPLEGITYHGKSSAKLHYLSPRIKHTSPYLIAIVSFFIYSTDTTVHTLQQSFYVVICEKSALVSNSFLL